MTTIVLCHGAWAGGWSWTGVANILRDQGHRVFVPTYTGLGERAHLAGPDVNLSTHIEDVRAVIKWEQLDQFVLAGHSYGGMVISGVADAEWQKITRLIYLDAFLPNDGQSLSDITGPERTAAAQATANEHGNGWRLPPPPDGIPDGMPTEGREWIKNLVRPQPLKTMTEKLSLAGNHLKVTDKVYVLASENRSSPFHKFAAQTQGQEGWTSLELPTHHHIFQSMPTETAAILAGEQ